MPLTSEQIASIVEIRRRAKLVAVFAQNLLDVNSLDSTSELFSAYTHTKTMHDMLSELWTETGEAARSYKAGFRSIAWDDVKTGMEVYLDNYQDGKFPLARRKISGMYIVIDATQRKLALSIRARRGFTHLPDNLLVKEPR